MISFGCLLLLCPPLVMTQAEELTPIFDGHTLNGWENRGDENFRVEDGVILATSGRGHLGWLCTKKEYGDFILQLEVKIDAGNSGVQIRSHVKDRSEMIGYQIEVDSSDRAWSGGLYDQGRRGWLQNLENNEKARKAFKVHEWNTYRIVCLGGSIRSWVNDVPVTDYVDTMDLTGIIALQIHGNKDEVRYRNIQLQDLGAHVWKPIWDGKTFNGWHPIGKGHWAINDRLIVARHEQAEKEFSHLVSDGTYKDFTVRLKYKATRGNSGLYFRAIEEGFSGLTGVQAEIDPTQDAGGLYETNGRGWLLKPTSEQFKKWFRPNEWNTMTVSAHHDRVVVNLNGYQTADLQDSNIRPGGRIALQLHGGQDVEVFFKDLEMLDASGSRAADLSPLPKAKL